MLNTTSSLDADFRIGTIDRRLFGSFVEHIGRCVYGGIYEPGSPQADQHGFRTDVLEATRELGTSLVRYPGGNFVSGYRWEDGIGPVAARPTRLDLAWRSVENNEFGLHEFMSWATQAAVEPMMAINLGTRGIEAACDLVEYANHPGGTALADLRRHNGATDPFAIKLWCLGNEVDGPWQLGHKTAAVYGALAAEAAKAMRQVDPTIELVVCGSSNPNMATFGAWESTVLEHTLDVVDFISVHAYFEQHGDDAASFLASGYAMDRYIDAVVSTADHVAAKKHSAKRLRLSFDEWNVWYQQRTVSHTDLDMVERPRLGEDRYSGLDAAVVGGLVMSLLRHADRVGVACLAQLVNVIAPIFAEADRPAWRQTIFHPIALSARHARGDVLDVRTRSELIDTEEHGAVPAVDVVATIDDDSGDLAIFAANRHPDEPATTTTTIRGLPPLHIVEQVAVGGKADWHRVNTVDEPDAVTARPRDTATLSDGVLVATLEPASWNLIRLAPLR